VTLYDALNGYMQQKLNHQILDKQHNVHRLTWHLSRAVC